MANSALQQMVSPFRLGVQVARPPCTPSPQFERVVVVRTWPGPGVFYACCSVDAASGSCIGESRQCCKSRGVTVLRSALREGSKSAPGLDLKAHAFGVSPIAALKASVPG